MTNLPKITTTNLTDWIDRHFVDFDRFFDGYNRTTTNYPPHNLAKIGDDKAEIEMAVAGFKPSEIEVSVEGNRLIVRAETSEESREDEKTYTYRGISKRSFSKSFYLPEHWEVSEARFEDGLLIVALEHNIPEEELPKRIEIKRS